MGDPVEPDWLALREPADAAARDRAWPDLAGRVRAWLADRPGPVHVVDVGAGTGANVRWLAPRLADEAPDRAFAWTLLDHDGGLLRHVPAGTDARLVRGDVADLPHLLDARPTLVTASALLDLLTADQLDRLVDDAAAGGAALLVALTIGPTTRVEPLDPAERDVAARLDEAFHEHQARGDALGHRAVDHLLRRHPDAVAAPAPWRLGAADRPLVERFLRDRVDAAVAARPALAEEAAAWRAARLAASAAGELTVTVDHVDLWLAPPTG